MIVVHIDSTVDSHSCHQLPDIRNRTIMSITQHHNCRRITPSRSSTVRTRSSKFYERVQSVLHHQRAPPRKKSGSHLLCKFESTAGWKKLKAGACDNASTLAAKLKLEALIDIHRRGRTCSVRRSTADAGRWSGRRRIILACSREDSPFEERLYRK